MLRKNGGLLLIRRALAPRAALLSVMSISLTAITRGVIIGFAPVIIEVSSFDIIAVAIVIGFAAVIIEVGSFGIMAPTIVIGFAIVVIVVEVPLGIIIVGLTIAIPPCLMIMRGMGGLLIGIGRDAVERCYK